MVAQDVFGNLISGCPQLEELKLIEVEGLGQINIHAPNLKLFQIIGEFESISFDNTFQLATILIDLWTDLNSETNKSRDCMEALAICSNFSIIDLTYRA
jgi:hypothetical protein